MRIAGAMGAVGLAAAMVAPRTNARVIGLLLWASGCVVLALELAPGGHGGLYALVAAIGFVVAAALAALFVRVPWTLPLLALACVPFRFEVEVGVTAGRLLVPLYVVVAGAALALLWRPRRGRDLGLVAWPLALLVALTGLSLLWSDDPRASATMLVLYVLPLGVLALALARLPWRPGWSALLALELAGLALGLAIAGTASYLTRDVSAPFGASVVSDWYYPVGPAFDDPRAYARFLLVGVVVALAVAIRVRDARAWAAAAAAVVAWVGLVPSFSQPAFVALAGAAVALLVAAWSHRVLFPAAVVLTVGAAVAGSFALLRADVLGAPGRGTPASVYDAIRVALDHPIAGVGIGAHTVPNAAATAVAELGAAGLVLLAAVVLAALAALRRERSVAAVALVATLVAVVVDGAFRGELLSDPLFWGVVGLAAAAARHPPPQPPRRPQAAP